ncbi:putative phage protein (TIGR02218 family) [Pacificibacter maritimus]|uniref:Putative phage protein (TIGR02218 family) n=1 Tax=Pacificibacter maritimus TaxID=762213 RepID=A0A3N4V2I2_9RHOB|nr:DUF2163 domain-containing protein [Pacificibacter maritimus]RPE71297.1 putative phage protein (TIGR02218 family) [Pacificibacter maritimus]
MADYALKNHLETGATTVCRCWAVIRKDGETYGFTDHDTDLEFEGMVFGADSGLTANALEQSTGLSVDNTEALGALSSAAVTETDIQAGRFDGAAVKSWLVNWANVSERVVQFNGTFGEITRSAGGFRAELRGLTEALNQPQGRVYQSGCGSVLGDARCKFDVNDLGYHTEIIVEKVEDGKFFDFASLEGFDDRWFENGRLIVQSGAAEGLFGMIKNDRLTSQGRRIELWEDLRGKIAQGDQIRLEAGCDKRAETCRLKFDNFLNFSGFPHIPGEDWLTSYPVSNGQNNGASLYGNTSGGSE